jgi:hypothetical protein
VSTWKNKAGAAAAARAYRARNREKLRQMERVRSQLPHRQEANRVHARARGRVLWEPRGLLGVVSRLREFDRFYFAGLIEREAARERCFDHLEWLESLDELS